jgi:cell wall-associated NlpC family hydrolase
VFFYDAGHVGIDIGHGQFVHAPGPGRTVTVARLAGISSRDYSGAVRIGPSR